MNIKTTIRKRCLYCQINAEVVNYAVREIPGYRNPLTNKNTAFVEFLSCGHEYISGKFNLDNIYFTAPKNKPIDEINNINYISYIPIVKKNKINAMDILCLGCLVVLSIICPALIITPILYFISRFK